MTEQYNCHRSGMISQLFLPIKGTSTFQGTDCPSTWWQDYCSSCGGGFNTTEYTQYNEDTQCMQRVSSVIEWRTRNRESLGSISPSHVQAAEVLSNRWNQTETFIPWIDVVRSLSFPRNTDCDTISLMKTAWGVFVKVHRLLQHLGEGAIRTSKVQYAEEFVCKLYRIENLTKIDEASVKLLNKYHPINIFWLESRKWTPCCQTVSINATTCTKSI